MPKIPTPPNVPEIPKKLMVTVSLGCSFSIFSTQPESGLEYKEDSQCLDLKKKKTQKNVSFEFLFRVDLQLQV